jgi:phosphoribosylcarboxyaminoimidazole (NCAIR) mutase
MNIDYSKFLSPGFTNALIYAAQIVGIHNPEVRKKVDIYKTKLRDEVLSKDD